MNHSASGVARSWQVLLIGGASGAGRTSISWRARTSWLYARWLKDEAEASGATVVPSRPWDTLFERVLQAIA